MMCINTDHALFGEDENEDNSLSKLVRQCPNQETYNSLVTLEEHLSALDKVYARLKDFVGNHNVLIRRHQPNWKNLSVA